jgi:hypothetical protein
MACFPGRALIANPDRLGNLVSLNTSLTYLHLRSEGYSRLCMAAVSSICELHPFQNNTGERKQPSNVVE